MLFYYALVFLVVGLIAGALGIYTVAAVASQIACVLSWMVAHLLLRSQPDVDPPSRTFA